MDEDPPIPLGRGRGPSSASSVAPLYGSQGASKTKAAGKPRLRFAEEQRASWPRSWHSKSDKGEKGAKKGEKSSKGGATPPVGGVYWSEEGEAANESQYTFYREGTPTPPEYNEDDRERALQYGGPIGMSGHSRGPSQGTAPSFDPPPLHPFRSRVCGMSKRLFLALVVIGLILVAVAIGTGVGVGLARKSTSPSPDLSNPNATSSASPAHATSTASSTTSSAPPAEATSALCGTTNNTIFSVPNSSKQFRRFCGLDFGGVGGAMDVTTVLTSDMEECMISCSGLASCTGCGWGIIVGDEGPKHRCWLKSNLQTPHNTTADWSFAILL